MSFNEHGEKILFEMGLSHSQAKLYVALLKMRTSTTANALSNSSKIARQDVYQILKMLQDLGLVEKIIANPVLFKAIPIRAATSMLMKKRSEKTIALMKEATDLFSEFSEKLVTPTDSQQFVLIPAGDAIVRRIKEAIKTTNKKIRIITPLREVAQWMFRLSQPFKQAFERGVKVLWIADRPLNLDSRLDLEQCFWRNYPFDLRTVPHPVNNRLGIYDDKELFVATTQQPDAAKAPALWTNNPTTLDILSDYFEMKWELAQEYNTNEN